MRVLLAAASVVLCSGALYAQETAPPVPGAPDTAAPAPNPEAPAPPPIAWGPAEDPSAITETPAELDEVASFVGTWRCEGASANGASAPRKLVSQIEIKPELDGFWLAGKEVREKTADAPALTRFFFWSFDPAVRQYVGGWLNSRGGWSTQTSFGWQRGELVMFGHVTTEGQKTQAREIFKRPGDGSFTRRYEILDGATNRWNLMTEVTCRPWKRAPARKRP